MGIVGQIEDYVKESPCWNPAQDYINWYVYDLDDDSCFNINNTLVTASMDSIHNHFHQHIHNIHYCHLHVDTTFICIYMNIILMNSFIIIIDTIINIIIICINNILICNCMNTINNNIVIITNCNASKFSTLWLIFALFISVVLQHHYLVIR